MPKTFTFNSKKSSDLGLVVQGATINKTPARPYDLQKIPGRAGLLIIDSSIDDLENVEITYTVGCKDIAANRDAIADWLFGSAAYAKLADSSDTSSYRMAICTSGQDWDEQIRNFGTAKLVYTRIIGKISAFTVLQYINYVNNRPIGRVKYALN